MEQTLAVARTLFAERGYAAVTMDEVAAEVGVTKPLLYNYFGNKERLYIACMERAGDALSATIVGARSPTSTPDEALRAGVHAFFAFLDSDARRLGGALRRDAPRRRRDRRARRRLPRPDPRPGHRRDLGQVPPRMQARPQVEVEAALGGHARRRRGARPLVAAHRGALRRGGRRAADRDDRARPAPR